MPNSSLFWSAVAGHPRQRWTPGDHIKADIYDAFCAANFKDPKPYPRPGEAEAAAARTSARAQRWIDRQAKTNGKGGS